MFTYDWKTHLDSGLPMLWLFVNSANEYTLIVCKKDYAYEYYRGKDGRLLLQRDITAISGLDLYPIVMLIGDSQYFDGVVLDSPGDSLRYWESLGGELILPATKLVKQARPKSS